MFLLLLSVTFVVALVICLITAKLFAAAIEDILVKIVASDIAYAWVKYLKFAVLVVGLSGGVDVYYLSSFIKQPTDDFTPPVLDFNHWVLEIYRTIIGSLQSIALLLFIFFVFGLIAYVIAAKTEK